LDLLGNEESFSHMNWHLWVQNFNESLWDVLEETIQSAGLLHCLSKQDLDQKLMHFLMEITSLHLVPSRGAYIFESANNDHDMSRNEKLHTPINLG